MLSTGKIRKITWSIRHSLKPWVLYFALPSTCFELVKTFHLSPFSFLFLICFILATASAEQEPFSLFVFVRCQPRRERGAAWGPAVDTLLVSFWGCWGRSFCPPASLGCARCCACWLARVLATLLLGSPGGQEQGKICKVLAHFGHCLHLTVVWFSKKSEMNEEKEGEPTLHVPQWHKRHEIARCQGRWAGGEGTGDPPPQN